MPEKVFVMKDLEIVSEDFSKTVVNKPEITIEGKGKGFIRTKGKKKGIRTRE